MNRYVALLRGINVGGKNPIKMAELRACFEANGFEAVATYIQSGNVVFDAGDVSPAALTEQIERALSEAFDYEATVIVRSAEQLRATVAEAPQGFGTQPDRFRYDVLFLKESGSAAAAITDIPIKEGVDEVHVGPDVLYFLRLTSRATQSRLSKIVSLPLYQQMTIRNWRTTTRLAQMVVTAD